MATEWDISELELRAVAYWCRLAADKYKINYGYKFDGIKKQYVLISDETAKLKQFGSGTQGFKAEFWLEKLTQEFKATMNDNLDGPCPPKSLKIKSTIPTILDTKNTLNVR